MMKTPTLFTPVRLGAILAPKCFGASAPDPGTSRTASKKQIPINLMNDAIPEVVARETRAVLEAMRGRAVHIFNLGHGLTPGAKLEDIQSVVNTVRGFQ